MELHHLQIVRSSIGWHRTTVVMADFSRRIIRGTVEFSSAEIIRRKTGSWCGLQLLLPDKVIHCPSACCGRKLDKLRPSIAETWRRIGIYTGRILKGGMILSRLSRKRFRVLARRGPPSDAPRKVCLLRCRGSQISKAREIAIGSDLLAMRR